MSDMLNSANESEPHVPQQSTKLPLRFWVMIDHGLLTREQAEAEWAKQQAAGVEFEPLS